MQAKAPADHFGVTDGIWRRLMFWFRRGSTPCADQKPAPKDGHLSLDFQYVTGAGEGTRTPDPIITNDVLYQLSYSGILLCAGY